MTQPKNINLEKAIEIVENLIDEKCKECLARQKEGGMTATDVCYRDGEINGLKKALAIMQMSLRLRESNKMECQHNSYYSCTPVIIQSGVGPNGTNRLTIRQPLECCDCGKFFYRWSHYNEDESTVAIRED